MEDKKNMKKPTGEKPQKQTELEKSTYVKEKEKEAAAAQKAAEKANRKAEKAQKPKLPLKERLKSPRFRHGAVAKGITVLVVVVLVLVNVLFSALSQKFPNMNIDMTTGGVNSPLRAGPGRRRKRPARHGNHHHRHGRRGAQ